MGNWKFAILLVAHIIVSASASRRLQNGAGGHQQTLCPASNTHLSTWLQQAVQEGDSILPKQATDFDSFLVELKAVLDKRPLPDRPIHYLLSDGSPFHPTCSGDWLEFGVFNAATLNLAATAKHIRCGQHCPPLFGFDTFTGLPDDWKRGENSTFTKGQFSLEGKLPEVAANVQLVKGIFADSLPVFEQEHARHQGDQAISYLHVDCDLYVGARDIFTHLSSRIRAGTVIVFDDLVNYNNYREGEVKALWEWLQASGAKLATLGMLGPLQGKDFSMDLHTNEPNGEHPWFHQSAAFVVAHPPQVHPEHQQEDPATRDPVLLDADALKMGGHLHTLDASKRLGAHAGARAQHQHASRGSREKHRSQGINADNLEAIIPVMELDSDPEGDVPQDNPAGHLAATGDLPQELPADTIEGLQKL